MDLYTRKLEIISDSLRKLVEIKNESRALLIYRGAWKNKDIKEN